MKLSIIIPVYNTREYLAVCLDSVLDNACNDYEIVIVNDGSTDDSGIIAAGYASRYPELIRVITTENGGLGAARNVGLEAAKGDYLLFLDSDDSLSRGALKEMLAAIDGSFDIGIFDLRLHGGRRFHAVRVPPPAVRASLRMQQALPAKSFP